MFPPEISFNIFDECNVQSPSPGHPSRYMYPLGTHCSLAERALNCGGIGRDDQLLEALTARNRSSDRPLPRPTGLCLDRPAFASTPPNADLGCETG